MVIAGAHNGLLFVSANGGAFWTNLPFEGQLAGVLHALEVDPRDKGTWYAGMEGDHPWTSGVYKTTDAGKSWKLLPATKGIAVWSLALWPADPDVVAAGTGDGVYRSPDAGESWARISAPGDEEMRPVVSLAFDPAKRDTLYAGTTHLPWRTTNGGETWESIHTGMIDDSDVFSIQVDARQPHSVYASACSGLYESPDDANHWTKLPTPKGAFRTWFVALDPRHSGTVFAGTTEGLLRSEDGGKGWRVVTPEAVRSIAFDVFVRDRIFFASTTAGLMLSTDGGRTLRASNVGFTNRNFTVLTGAKGVLYANSVFEPGSGGVYRTDNFGLRWQRASEPAGQEIRLMSAAPDQPGALFAAGYHGLLKSKDGGKTWSERSSPAGSHFTALLALPHEILLAATDQGLFRSDDGINWEAKSSSGAGSISALGASGSGASVVAVGAQGAMVSRDAGATWRACGQPASSASWYGLAFDAAASHTALAATSAGLFRSTDDCKSWSRDSTGLLTDTVSVVLFHPTRSGEAYAAQDGHLFRSSDGGKNWQSLDDDEDGRVWPTALMVLPEAPDRLIALFPRRGVSLKTLEEKAVEVVQFRQLAAK
jgi:photosystem II stability/assembly factor-like uncharacterized protein